MKLSVGFDGDERTFESVSPGKYAAFVNSIVEKGTPEKPVLNVRLVIAEGQFQQRSVFTNCVLTPEAKWKLQNLLLAAGLVKQGTKGDWNGDTNDLIGKKVGVTVIEEEYNGEMRAAVKNFYTLAESATPAPAPVPAPAGGTAPAPQGPPPPPKAPAPAGRRL